MKFWTNVSVFFSANYSFRVSPSPSPPLTDIFFLNKKKGMKLYGQLYLFPIMIWVILSPKYYPFLSEYAYDKKNKNSFSLKSLLHKIGLREALLVNVKYYETKIFLWRCVHIYIVTECTEITVLYFVLSMR